MTAFTTANLPPNCNTVEKVAVWAAVVLRELNPNTPYLETELLRLQAATNVQIPIVDGSVRNISRLALPLAAGYASGGAKLWTFAQELSTTALLTTHTTN
jgi:hypothetical protein